MSRRAPNHRLAEISASVRKSDNARLVRRATDAADDAEADNRAARRAAARKARKTVASTVDAADNGDREAT